tara:strand:+ start:392 stop:496 length:105 start_codon:yes stop_codon:yes gene_type:complete
MILTSTKLAVVLLLEIIGLVATFDIRIDILKGKN